jgi:heat shock protein HslJ
MHRFIRIMLACVLVVGAVAAITGCSAKAKSDPKALVGEWSLQSSSISSADLGAANITAIFTAKEVSGFSGVNQYGGSYTAKDDGSIEFGQMRSTLMAGPDAAMKAESTYLKALQSCDAYVVAGERMTLLSKGSELLVYKKAASAGLPGTKWSVTGYNNGKEAVVGLEASSTITLDFGTDKTLSGNGGVNNYNGSYQVRDDTIVVGELASTKMAGPEALMTQEQLYLTALKKAVSWKVQGGMLEMRDWNGALQVVAKSGSGAE